MTLPDWPGRMGEDMAASYMGVSRTTFLSGVAARRFPQPVREGKRKLWARAALDRFIMAQAGLDNAEERPWAV